MYIYVRSRAFSALHWQRASKHGCTMRLSNSKQNRTSFAEILLSIRSLQMEIFLHIFVFRPARAFARGTRPHGLTFTWWGSYGLFSDINQLSLPAPFYFCSRVRFCLYGPFNCISFHKFSRQLSAFSLLFRVLFLPYWSFQLYLLFTKVSLSPDLILYGWLGLRAQAKCYRVLYNQAFFESHRRPLHCLGNGPDCSRQRISLEIHNTCGQNLSTQRRSATCGLITIWRVLLG